jgi:hypothetical protein
VLFENGSRLRVDLNDMTTTWTTSSNERRTRPLEAFSSGERAFAYTRVQLEEIGHHTSDNKVVFLDEFGAYVARDRLSQLLAFIRNRVLGKLADQVLVVLPLGSDPHDEGQQNEIAQRGYFVEEFV